MIAANDTVAVRTMASVVRTRYGGRLLEGVYPDDTGGYARFVRWSRQVACEALPDDLLDAFHRMARDPKGPAALLVVGGPTDPDPGPTPDEARRSTIKPTHVSEGVLLGTIGLLGYPYSMAHERGTELVNEVIATATDAATTSSKGCVELPWHTEHLGHDPRPDFLALTCVRNAASGGATMVADGRAAYSALSPRCRRALRRPEFFFRQSVLFDRRERWIGPKPVFSGPEDSPRLRICDFGTHASTKSGAEALDRLRVALTDSAASVTLRPGDCLYIANTYAAHARTPFDAALGSRERRWIQRAFAIADPRRFPPCSDPHRMIFDGFRTSAM